MLEAFNMMGGIPTHKELLRALQEQGWSVDNTKQGHYKARAPDGVGLVLFCETTEPRGMKNNISDLRRSGFQWPPPPKAKPVRQDEDAERVAAAHPAPRPHLPAPATSAPRVVSVLPAKKPADLDSLYKNLKDVKVELGTVEGRLAEAERVVRQAEVALGAAKEQARVAQEQVDMVKRLVMEAKVEFDQVFDVSA